MVDQSQVVNRRYSDAFRRKVVSEIERGELSITQARKLYDIGGKSTIQKWIKSLGKNHLLPKRVRIEMPKEIDKLKQLEAEKKELESALAQAYLRVMSLESMLELAGKEVGEDLLKKYATRVSGESKIAASKRVKKDTR
jgi:transposase-like protein